MTQGFKTLIVIIVALVVYALAAAGVPDREPPEWLYGATIAHRGEWTQSAERPENSLAAFETAVSHGYAVELDVHRTSDGQVVVIHDSDLKRMTGADGTVEKSTLAQLEALRLNGGTEKIPTLDQVLAAVNGRVPVLVEIKNEGKVGALEKDVAEKLAAYAGESAAMSFNPFSLAVVAEAAPEIPRGQLSGSFKGEHLAWYKAVLLRYLAFNWKSRPDFVAYELKLVPSPVTDIQRRIGRLLVGWTADSPQQRVKAEKTCDAVICNPPALAR